VTRKDDDKPFAIPMTLTVALEGTAGTGKPTYVDGATPVSGDSITPTPTAQPSASETPGDGNKTEAGGPIQGGADSGDGTAVGVIAGLGGRPIPLLEQNRARWDQLLIRRGLRALARVEALGGSSGPYALQAAIAACHVRAATAEATDWPRIAALYDALAQLTPSPIVELNRAVAVGMAYGPAAGLELADALRDEPSLAAYHLLPAVRGDLLAKLDRHEEAADEFARAAAMTRNVPERTLLLERAAEANRRGVDGKRGSRP